MPEVGDTVPRDCEGPGCDPRLPVENAEKTPKGGDGPEGMPGLLSRVIAKIVGFLRAIISKIGNLRTLVR